MTAWPAVEHARAIRSSIRMRWAQPSDASSRWRVRL